MEEYRGRKFNMVERAKQGLDIEDNSEFEAAVSFTARHELNKMREEMRLKDEDIRRIALDMAIKAENGDAASRIKIAQQFVDFIKGDSQKLPLHGGLYDIVNGKFTS